MRKGDADAMNDVMTELHAELRRRAARDDRAFARTWLETRLQPVAHT